MRSQNTSEQGGTWTHRKEIGRVNICFEAHLCGFAFFYALYCAVTKALVPEPQSSILDCTVVHTGFPMEKSYQRLQLGLGLPRSAMLGSFRAFSVHLSRLAEDCVQALVMSFAKDVDYTRSYKTVCLTRRLPIVKHLKAKDLLTPLSFYDIPTKLIKPLKTLIVPLQRA